MIYGVDLLMLAIQQKLKHPLASELTFNAWAL